jgi:hypothetical protein
MILLSMFQHEIVHIHRMSALWHFPEGLPFLRGDFTQWAMFCSLAILTELLDIGILIHFLGGLIGSIQYHTYCWAYP